MSEGEKRAYVQLERYLLLDDVESNRGFCASIKWSSGNILNQECRQYNVRKVSVTAIRGSFPRCILRFKVDNGNTS